MIFWSPFLWSPLLAPDQSMTTGRASPGRCPLILESLPSRWWKGDMPEARRGYGEFHRDQIALLMFDGCSRHPAALLLRSPFVNQIEFCLHGEILGAKQHCPMVIYRRGLGAHGGLCPG